MAYKVVLVGDASVGKSALVVRFTRHIFPESTEATVGAAFTPHTVQLGEEQAVSLEIWDTAGQERFASLAPMYFRGAAAALVVFDQASAKSFDRAKKCVLELHEQSPSTRVIALLANKADLAVKEVSLETASAFAEEHNLLFFETSAKTGLNVQAVFTTVAERLYTNGLKTQAQQEPTVMKLTDESDATIFSRCC